MLLMHSRGIIIPKNNCVKHGGSMLPKSSNIASYTVPNNPIFGLSTAPNVKANSGIVIGSSINFNKNKRKSNIKLII